jgi:uncharacterized iron-regulated membrane protein
MSSIRIWHTYIGFLIAPSVLFFALTGALQIFSLHEAHGSYEPPPLIEKLSRLHKDQVFEQKEHKEDKSEGAGAQEHPKAEKEDEPRLGTVLLKWFCLLVALGLSISTLLGLWMGLKQLRRRRTGWWLLAVGIILPAALIFL